MRHCAVLASSRSQQAEGGRLISSLRDAGIDVEIATFDGECSRREIQRHVDALRTLDEPVTGLAAIGGGKVVDAGRAIAHRLAVPVAVIPSLASNDAPCAALSVIYTPEGVTEDAEIYDSSPALVLVDSGVIAKASPRYLVAGMGDAMATWYEARACARASHGLTVYGGRPTLAATALAEACARTLYEDGESALEAVRKKEVTAALDRVIEANTLLSGIGYECGGLAVAHGIAQGYTVIDEVHNQCLHGEMVAMGTLTQLLLEASHDPAAESEAEKAASFFARVGLPTRLEQLGLSPDDEAPLQQVIAAAMQFPFIGNMPFPVTADALLQAVLAADKMGRRMM
jgi:glycerol dehydrogenase